MREYGPRATDGVTFRIVRGHLPARTRVILSNMYCSVFAGFIGFFGISRYRYIGSVSLARLENPKKGRYPRELCMEEDGARGRKNDDARPQHKMPKLAPCERPPPLM